MRNRIQLITLAALLSGLTFMTLSLNLVLPWFNIVFPVILPIIMSYAFYRLHAFGYLLYGLSIIVLSLILGSLGFGSLLSYILHSLILGGFLGWMLQLRLGWLDILIIFPWIHMGVTYGSMILLDALFELNLDGLLNLIFPQTYGKILGLYAISLFTSVIIVWFLVEDRHRLKLSFHPTLLPRNSRKFVLWIFQIILIISSLWMIELAMVLFGPLLWLTIYFISFQLRFETKTMVIGLISVLLIFISLVGLSTFWPTVSFWLFIPTFITPFIHSTSFTLD